MTWKITLPHRVTGPFNVTIFITHVRNCVIGATPMLVAYIPNTIDPDQPASLGVV